MRLEGQGGLSFINSHVDFALFKTFESSHNSISPRQSSCSNQIAYNFIFVILYLVLFMFLLLSSHSAQQSSSPCSFPSLYIFVSLPNFSV